jgi:signal peptidase II
MKKKSNKTMLLGLLAILLLVAIDQFTKYLATAFLAGNASAVLLPGVFELRYLENRSAAFGFDFITFLQDKFPIAYFTAHPDVFLSVKMGIFAVLTIAVCVLLLSVFWRVPEHDRRFAAMDVILIAFIAGAVGNCIDRVTRGYVVDFFYFSLIDFPIFNVADIYVTVSAFFIVVLGLFYYKEEDFERIFPPKKKKDTNL